MSNYSTLGYINIAWTDAEKDTSWYAWRVYRRVAIPLGVWELLYETQVDQSSYNYHDWTAKVGTTYQWAIVQVALRFDQPVESDYFASTQYVPFDDQYWLINPDDESMNVRLRVKGEEFYEEQEEATIPLIGRGRRKEFGTNYGLRGTIAASIRRDNVLTPHEQRTYIENLRRSLDSFIIRNPFGDVLKVTTGDIKMSRIPGVGADEMMDVNFDYEEVV